MSNHRRKRRQRRLRRLIGFLLLFLVSFTLITTYLVEVVRITDDSMVPAVEPGDVLLSFPILHLIDRFRKVERGDLVMVENPVRPERGLWSHLARRFLHFFSFGRLDRSDEAGTPLLLRRVVALPGERIIMDEYEFFLRDADGRWVSELELTDDSYELSLPRTRGEQLPWPALHTPGAPDAPAETIPGERYFLAADHRGGALDSRLWGPVPLERLHGAVLLRLLPLDRFGPLSAD